MRVTKLSDAEYLKRPRLFSLSNAVKHDYLKIGFPQHLTRVGLELKKEGFAPDKIIGEMTEYGNGLMSLPYDGRYKLTNDDIERCIKNVLNETDKGGRIPIRKFINVLDGVVYHNFYDSEWNPGLRFLMSSIMTEYMLLSGFVFPLGFLEIEHRNKMGWVTAQQYFQILYHKTDILTLIKPKIIGAESNQYSVNTEHFYAIMRSINPRKKVLHPDLKHLVSLKF